MTLWYIHTRTIRGVKVHNGDESTFKMLGPKVRQRPEIEAKKTRKDDAFDGRLVLQTPDRCLTNVVRDCSVDMGGGREGGAAGGGDHPYLNICVIHFEIESSKVIYGI